MSKVNLTGADERFLKKKALPYFGIPAVRIISSSSTEKYPDIWVKMTPGETPEIYITAEWRRQDYNERRKRLTHELLHVGGMEHNEKVGYNSRPAEDTYSMAVYKKIMGGGKL